MLFAKLAKVLGEVHRVPKNGRNQFQKYDYTTESDAADHLRPLLAKHGIGVLVAVADVQREDNGITLVRVDITLGDESGATLTTTSYGEARDVDSKGSRQDKGLYKAVTGAVKYWMFKTFLISTGDDPEADAGNEPETRNRKAAPTPQPNVKPPKRESQPSEEWATASDLAQLSRLLDNAPLDADQREYVEKLIQNGCAKSKAAEAKRRLEKLILLAGADEAAVDKETGELPLDDARKAPDSAIGAP